MGAIKRNIPNFITCLNLVCGFMGISAICHHQGEMAIFFVLLALIFDFLDGFVARLLKVTSAIGKDLDSLADIVTFGVLPGIMMFEMLDFSWQIKQLSSPLIPAYVIDNNLHSPILSVSLFAILIPVFSAIRLAKFNHDIGQSFNFKGLPTPAVGILITSLYSYFLTYKLPALNKTVHHMNVLEYIGIDFLTTIRDSILHFTFNNSWVLIMIAILFSFLLVSNVPLLAMKFKKFGWPANQWKYILLILSLPLIIFLGFASAPIILILYIIVSQIHFRTTNHEI